MARLTARQLRAIFAKLGKVKLQATAARGPTVYVKSGIVHTDMDRIFSPAIAEHYIRRVPQSHRDLAAFRGVTQVKVWDRWIRNDIKHRHTRGLYDGYTREIHVSRDIDRALQPTGYFVKSGFQPRITRRDIERPRGSITLGQLVRWRTIQARNAKVGAAHTFYHEYAHSILAGYLDKFDELYPPGWKRSARTREWRLSLGARRLTSPERAEEAFADAYSSYATTKKTRTQLKHDAPRSYEYMKRFFEMGELD